MRENPSLVFSHGDLLTLGAFAGLATFIGLGAAGIASPTVLAIAVAVAAALGMALLGALIAQTLVLPLASAPPLNVLLITLMRFNASARSVMMFLARWYWSSTRPRTCWSMRMAVSSL